MTTLSRAERELVALGAALGSNCVPCIEYHVPEARKAGLDDRQIDEAIRLADKVRQVPARKVLAAAVAMLAETPAETRVDEAGAGSGQTVPEEGGCCGQSMAEKPAAGRGRSAANEAAVGCGQPVPDEAAAGRGHPVPEAEAEEPCCA